MILEELVRYATDNKLIKVPGYQEQEIRWLVCIRADGTYVNIEDTLPERDETTKRPRATRSMAPVAPKRSNNIVAQALVDNALYVFGIGTGRASDSERVPKCAAAFRTLMRTIADASHEAAPAAALRFLERYDAGEYHEHIRGRGFASNDKFGFVLEPERFVLHDPANAAIRSVVTRICKPADAHEAVCLICGQVGLIARLHPAIKGLRGTQPSGGSLISFEPPSFQSHALEQGDVAPCCVTCATAYAETLNGFLRPHSGHCVRLGERSAIVFWTRGAGEETDSIFGHLFDGDPEEVKRLYESPHSGRLSESDPESARFNVLVMSGAGGRVAARGWHERTIDDALDALKLHFDDLEIAGPLRSRGIRRLGESLVRSTKTSGAAPSDAFEAHVGGLLQAALYGTPYPAALLSLALERVNAEPNLGHRNRADQALAAARHAVIKAVLRRWPAHPYGDLMPDLDPDSKRPAYLCGRLLAALDHAQESALGTKINASIVDRYYGAASSSPAKVFGELIRNAQNHIAKIDGNGKGGLAAFLQRQIGEIMEPLQSFPRMLTVEERGLFALGFYHQRQARFKRRETADSNTLTTTEGDV